MLAAMADRTFLRGLEGKKYNLKEHRQQRLQAQHVLRQEDRSWRDEKAVGHEDASRQSRAKWVVGPGDDPFLTQTVQCHFVAIDPGGSNGGHGHQNEAAFYILQGRGYEIHDAQRYDWQAGDLVVVHNDSHHQHFNASSTEPALAIVVKPKCAFMYLGLTQQGRGTTVPDGHDDDYGPREEWSGLWTPGVSALRKVVHSEDERWAASDQGRIRWLARSGMNVRLFGIDVWLQELGHNQGGGAHWHMADELYYVVSGSGESLEWGVEADIDDRYYARVSRKPRRHRWQAGDVLYVPQNTVHSLAGGRDGALLLGAQNRLFKLLGYDSVVSRRDLSEQAATVANFA